MDYCSSLTGFFTTSSVSRAEATPSLRVTWTFQNLHLTSSGEVCRSVLLIQEVNRWKNASRCRKHPEWVFAVEASQNNGISLNDPKEFEINERNTSVFQFILPKDTSKTQLDITVTSDSDALSYLKVSRICQDIKDNIRFVDYRGESIRLTFARKGRITLSEASIPSLADSASWYIGISLNNTTGTRPLNANTGTLTLTKSYAPFFCGGIAVVWALIRFKEPHVNLFQSSNSQVTWGEVCPAIADVTWNQWFAGGPKTFSYITCIVGCVLLMGAFQFVYAD